MSNIWQKDNIIAKDLFDNVKLYILGSICKFMVNTEITNHLKIRFKNQNIISTNEITTAILDAYPDVAPSTVGWRIFQLKKEKLVFQVGRGLYTFEYKPEFIPTIAAKTKRQLKRIKTLVPYDLYVFDTHLLSDIIEKPIEKEWMFISAPKDELDQLYDKMLDLSKQVFLHTDKETMHRYINAQSEAIILTTLVTEAPLYNGDDFNSFTLEGILVNVLFEADILLGNLGVDYGVLFEKAFEKYNVNRSKLLRYASRRDKKVEIENLIKKISKNGK